MEKAQQSAAPELLKLDLGAGKNKLDGYLSVDAIDFEGVDVVTDLTEPWPWDDNSVGHVHCSHFVEHLRNDQRVHFWIELYRVLAMEAQANIVTPHWSNACAYGDPTHQWPPMSEWAYYYLNEEWRDINAPHVPLPVNFDWVIGGSWEQWLQTRNEETRMFSMTHYINSYRDLMVTLTKRPRRNPAE